MANTLNEIKIGSDAVVSGILGDSALKSRFMDMGITKGAKVRVVKAAPLGDPIEICIRGYSLSLRKEDAKNILVNG